MSAEGFSPSSSVTSSRPEVPASQALSKRWTKKVPAPLSLTSASAWSLPRLRPGTVPSTTLSSAERPQKWGWGMAGYEAPGGPQVTDSQIQAAKSLVKAPTRVRQMIRDPVVRRACENVGVEPQELIPKRQAEFSKAEDHAFPVAKEVAEKQWESYLLRMGRKLALVQAERDRLLAFDANEKKEARDKLNRTMVATMQQELETEAQRVEREEKELSKTAYVIALEDAQNQERLEKLQANMEERERRLLQRQERLEEEKARLRARAKAREALTAKKNQAIEAMEQQVIAELEEEWQEKERKIELIKQEREANLASHRARKAMEFKKKQDVKVKADKIEVQVKMKKEASLKAKANRAAEVAAKLAAEREAAILDRQLRFKEKRDNAVRVKKAVYARKVAFVEALHAQEERLEQWKTAKEAIAEDRKSRSRELHLAKHMYRTHQQDIRLKVPGPGAYEMPPSDVNREGLNGAQSGATFKHEFDVVADQTRKNPGPLYEFKSTLKNSGGRLSKTSGKSDIEQQMHVARKLPGAGHYSPAMVRSRSTTTIPEGRFPTDFDHIRERSKHEPSPGAYSGPRVPRSPPRLQRLTQTMKEIGESSGMKPMFSPLASTASMHMKRRGKPKVKVDLEKTRFSMSFRSPSSLSETL